MPNDEAVVALSLLFEKVHLPNNVEIIKNFVRKYRFSVATSGPQIKVAVSEDSEDPFSDMSPPQQRAAKEYLACAISFAVHYEDLFGEVFESQAFVNEKIIDVRLVKKGDPGKLNTYEPVISPMVLTGGDESYFPKLVNDGYVPVVGYFHGLSSSSEKYSKETVKEMAALLAMKSVQMMIPRPRSC